ncbi:ImmA/IrrE family metallo-endopeptidase [Sphingomonas parva]|uniref:ImmA/IrrE family metallo-endopeptidase n=1 Tax=Sphingomonas parva TaxID=2555898 RepID=A0A4Y8ZRF8_9SPHN|nr:ImmA/IrrE family metallo-endopeptidase [Sphingomonas parva]TFI58628.1 ImmA/IrrE family metallo-endopeptidase [Sphingomonas parva]
MTVSAERKREVRERARSLVADRGVSRPPVPVDRIAKALNIFVQYAPLDEELSGMAFIKDASAVIAVNALHHPNRQRFTIAHELAHHVLHEWHLRTGVHVDKVILERASLAALGVDDLEIEANAFASELLMPRDLFEPLVHQEIDLNDEAQLTVLAKRFRVSMAALQFRLAALD